MEKIKAWLKEEENQKFLINTTAGFLAGMLVTRHVYKKAMRGREVHSVWDTLDAETRERIGKVVVLNNGTEVPFEIPIGMTWEEYRT